MTSSLFGIDLDKLKARAASIRETAGRFTKTAMDVHSGIVKQVSVCDPENAARPLNGETQICNLQLNCLPPPYRILGIADFAVHIHMHGPDGDHPQVYHNTVIEIRVSNADHLDHYSIQWMRACASSQRIIQENRLSYACSPRDIGYGLRVVISSTRNERTSGGSLTIDIPVVGISPRAREMIYKAVENGIYTFPALDQKSQPVSIEVAFNEIKCPTQNCVQQLIIKLLPFRELITPIDDKKIELKTPEGENECFTLISGSARDSVVLLVMTFQALQTMAFEHAFNDLSAVLPTITNKNGGDRKTTRPLAADTTIIGSLLLRNLTHDFISLSKSYESLLLRCKQYQTDYDELKVEYEGSVLALSDNIRQLSNQANRSPKSGLLSAIESDEDQLRVMKHDMMLLQDENHRLRREIAALTCEE